MSYPQGYPQQQPSGYPQQPSGMYQGGGGYPAQTGGGSNPVTAIVAAVLGLAAAVSLVVLDVHFLNDEIPDRLSFGDLPGAFKTMVILRFVGVLVLLVGIVLVLVRKLAGAFILILGALAAIAVVLLYPVVVKDYLPNLEYSEYLKEIFKFKETPSTFSAIALIASPLALILAILPPTLSYLRGSGRQDPYPQQTYPQQPTAW